MGFEPPLTPGGTLFCQLTSRRAPKVHFSTTQHIVIGVAGCVFIISISKAPFRGLFVSPGSGAYRCSFRFILFGPRTSSMGLVYCLPQVHYQIRCFFRLWPLWHAPLNILFQCSPLDYRLPSITVYSCKFPVTVLPKHRWSLWPMGFDFSLILVFFIDSERRGKSRSPLANITTYACVSGGTSQQAFRYGLPIAGNTVQQLT